MSLAGQEAAAARRQANSTIGYYNLRLGPTGWRFGSSLAAEYNSNVRYTDEGESDFIIRPGASARMLWPLTDQNSLNLNIGGGYSAYLENTDLSRFFINPGSEIAFDFYAGDFWINLHDRFSITQDTYQDPTVSGVGDYSRLENDAGIGVLWDLNKIVLRAGFDHVNYSTLQGSSSRGNSPDGQNEVFSISAGYEIQPQLVAGLEEGFAYVQYAEDKYTIFTDALQWNSGAFADAKVTDYISLRASGGYTVFDPEVKSAASRQLSGLGADEQLDGFYASVVLRHRVNQFFDYSINAGRNISYTFYGGTVDLYQVSWQGNWKLFKEITLGTNVSYDGGTQYNYGREEFDRIGGGVSVARAITKKMTSSVGAQYYSRDSDWPSGARDYSAFIASLNVSYTF